MPSMLFNCCQIMITTESVSFAPPWGTKPQWQEANRSIADICRRYAGQLNATVALAAALRGRLASVFSLLDALCLETCPRCPDPCCLHARPWFDFRDLLLLHLNNLAIPISQTIENSNSTCRYYGPCGCTLDRLYRPWICTWYLCPTQTSNLNRRRYLQHHDFSLAVSKIKGLRQNMEDMFIRVTA